MQINSRLCPYAASLLNANEKVFWDHGFIHFTHNMRAHSRRAFNNQTHSASAVPQTNTIRCSVATTGIIKRGLLQSETHSKFNCTVFLSSLTDRMKACFYFFGFLLTSSHRFLLSKPSTSPLKSQTPHLDFQNLDSVFCAVLISLFPQVEWTSKGAHKGARHLDVTSDR